MGLWMEVATPHGPVSAWKVEPPAQARGAIVVIQEIFGVNPHIRQVAEDFASQGYVTLAPAFFDLIEPGVQLDYDAAGIEKGRTLIGMLGLEKSVDIVDCAARTLSGNGHVGSVGYCWGGTVALLAALRLGMPSVSYYGARNVPFLGEPPRTPVMFHFGERDASIPPDMVAKHRELMPQMPVHVYPAGHGFNCDMRADYDAESARLARQRTLDFFAGTLA